MSTIKEALLKKYEEIFGYIPVEDEYQPRLRNRKEIVCQGKYSQDEIIDFWDTSINLNGKSGLALTIDSICVKDSGNFTTKFIAKYADIDYTHMERDSFLGVDLTKLVLEMKYGSTYEISIDKMDKDDLMDFIDYAISLYEEEDKLEW